MSVLGIFTVKRFHKHEGRYYTYGGFGGYLEETRKHFDKTIMIAHVRAAPPPDGFYEVALGQDLEIVGVPYLRTELGALASLPFVFFQALRHVPRMDVIHARMPDYTGVVGAAVARLYRKPCFHQIIDDWAGLANSVPSSKAFGLGLVLKAHLRLYDYLERLVSRGQLVFAQGAAAYEKHVGAGDRRLTLSAAHRLSDMGAIRPKFTGTVFRILNVGRLQSVKNQALIIQAMPRLLKRDSRWRLTIVGEGGKRGELLALAEALGVANQVELAGRVSHGPELWAKYDTADVFVLSSTSEGTPKVILEAMARGTPVIASAVSGVPTAVSNKERGLLFENNDLDGLVSALEQMCADTPLREACAKAAHAFAEDHTLEASTNRMIDAVAARWPHLQLRRPDAEA